MQLIRFTQALYRFRKYQQKQKAIRDEAERHQDMMEEYYENVTQKLEEQKLIEFEKVKEQLQKT